MSVEDVGGGAGGSGALTTVVADFFGVCTSPLAEAFSQLPARLDIPPMAIARAMAAITEADGAHPLFELECGRMTEVAFHARLEEQLRADLGRPVGIEAFPEIYFELLETNHELVERLEQLQARGYRMACLTNNVLEWGPRWRAMVPDDLFSVVVDSAEVGLRKPDPEIYRVTEELLGVPGSEILFVDDFESNCEAAREAGWTAVWLQDTGEALDELEAHLAERGVPAMPGG